MPRTPRPLQAPQSPRLDDEPGRVAGADVAAAVSGTRVMDAESAGARIAGLRLVDVAVERGNLANLVAPEPYLRRVTITGARLTGARWTRGSLADVWFRDCRIDLATFAGTTFERVLFEDCLLGQTEFRDALWRSVRFERCDLTQADFTGLRIDRCELRGCTLDGAAGLERLRGAAMPWADVLGHAAQLATALGIRVLDDEDRS